MYPKQKYKEIGKHFGISKQATQQRRKILLMRLQPIQNKFGVYYLNTHCLYLYFKTEAHQILEESLQMAKSLIVPV